MDFVVPSIEFGMYTGGLAVIPAITLSVCERTEKERIIKVDAYSLTISITPPEVPENESYCYAYASAVCKAFEENPTLGGIVDRAVITAKKYVPPKKPDCWQGWELFLTLRITIEGMTYAG
jgi:hypothetical protein